MNGKFGLNSTYADYLNWKLRLNSTYDDSLNGKLMVDSICVDWANVIMDSYFIHAGCRNGKLDLDLTCAVCRWLIWLT